MDAVVHATRPRRPWHGHLPFSNRRATLKNQAHPIVLKQINQIYRPNQNNALGTGSVPFALHSAQKRGLAAPGRKGIDLMAFRWPPAQSPRQQRIFRHTSWNSAPVLAFSGTYLDHENWRAFPAGHHHSPKRLGKKKGSV
jgi:hypothetical protein